MPVGRSAALNAVGTPPVTAIFLTAPLDQNASHCPSGEKTGSAGSVLSVPAMGAAVSSFRLRRYSCRFATYVSREPSGDSASTWRPVRVNASAAGRFTANLDTAGGDAAFGHSIQVTTPMTAAPE